MILKDLIKTGIVTINYYRDGVIHKCKGRIQNLNLMEQSISFKDQQENILCIRLSKIIEIN